MIIDNSELKTILKAPRPPIKDMETLLTEYAWHEDLSSKIYNYIKNLASYLCMKHKVKYDDQLIQDMSSHAAMELPKCYDKKKGKAKTFLYIILKRYLMDYIKNNSRQKRDSKMLLYLEDIGGPSVFYEVEYDDIESLKDKLLNNRELFEQLKTKLQRKIAFKLIDVIITPPSLGKQSVAQHISKKCKCGLTVVYATIKAMRALVNNSPPPAKCLGM